MSEVSVKSKEKIIDTIKTFIIDNFLFSNESEMIKQNESFMENGIIDSTGILELVEFVEETFNISIEDDELIPENLDSLQNVSTFIVSKQN